jgi:hypothetical protein
MKTEPKKEKVKTHKIRAYRFGDKFKIRSLDKFHDVYYSTRQEAYSNFLSTLSEEERSKFKRTTVGYEKII